MIYTKLQKACMDTASAGDWLDMFNISAIGCSAKKIIARSSSQNKYSTAMAHKQQTSC
jgi:hypothetical protein